MIHWQDGSAEISGDAAAVAAFEEAIQGAIATKYMDSYPTPGLVIIDARPTDIQEMISVLRRVYNWTIPLPRRAKPAAGEG